MGNELPDPTVYVGNNSPGGCQFHEHLARLGKTSLTSAGEYHLLGRSEPRPFGDGAAATADENSDHNQAQRRREQKLQQYGYELPNPVFLYEPSQLFDSNETRALVFRRNLSDFLGLERLLPPMKNTRVGKGSDYHYKIDVCEPRYSDLRRHLVELGRNASEWIATYFLTLPDVYYSSVDGNFEAMLASWSEDPCEDDEAERPELNSAGDDGAEKKEDTLIQQDEAVAAVEKEEEDVQ